MDENRSSYRPLSATPEYQPDPSRVGVVRIEPGLPFEHFCDVCGAWGAFGFGSDHAKEKLSTWFCGEHRKEGERRWGAGV